MFQRQKIKGVFPLEYLKEEFHSDKKAYQTFLSKDHRKNFLIVDDHKISNVLKKSIFNLISKDSLRPAGLLIIEDDKLTFGREKTTSRYIAILHILRKSIPEHIKNISLDIDCKKKRTYKSANVAAMIEGKQQKDSFIVFTAHYDHIGSMGANTYFPGANDNASGVGMLLSLAKNYTINPAKYSMVFIAFGAEEQGLLGSEYFAAHPLLNLDHIRFLINLDILGTGDDGIRVVNATIFNKEFERLLRINRNEQLLKQIRKRGEAAISDHYPFYINAVPCFYIYTLGEIKAYHDIYDQAVTLPLTEFDDIYTLLTLFVNSF